MNYMQYSPQDARIKGALNLGHGKATALSYFFQFWCYICPVFGAWVADLYWGKYKTIKNFSYVYIVGIFILFVSSLPAAAEKGYAMSGFLLAIVIIGLGTGGVKANVSPLIADCVPKFEPYVEQQQQHTNSKVIVDPKLTVLSVFMVFYLCINIGSLSSIITTTLESKVDFWAAYLLAFGFFCIGIVVFISGEKHYTHVPPSKRAISQCFKITTTAIRNGFDFEICKNYMAPAGEHRIGMSNSNFDWDDRFVEDVASALRACKVFLFFIPYWAIYGQMLNNFISQAGQMELHGIPNDILPNIDPITIIIFIPICDRFVYPLIRRCGLQFTALHKITWGFMFGSMAMVYAGFVQYLIYSSGPCYNHPLTCNPENQNNINNNNSGGSGSGTGSGQLPNQVHVAIQAPAYFFIAISEILASVTGLEYAYNCAPDTMKSFIMSLFLLTSAAGSLLGMIVAPLARDPFMVWFYGGLGVCCFVSGVMFWYFCKGIGNDPTVMGATGKKEEIVEHDEAEVALLGRRRNNSDEW